MPTNDGFNIQIGAFNGPLDLLLGLIQERKLYINEISLAEVTDEYLSYAERIREISLGETAQFVLIAATLLLIKSRSLLPHLELTSEEEENIEELEKRLAQYKLFKDAAKQLQERWGARLLLFGPRRITQTSEFTPAEASVESIHAAAKRLVQTLPIDTFRESASVAPVISIEETILSLENRVKSALKASFSQVTKSESKENTIVHFLALLELLKSEALGAIQEGNFGDIMIESTNTQTPHYGS